MFQLQNSNQSKGLVIKQDLIIEQIFIQLVTAVKLIITLSSNMGQSHNSIRRLNNQWTFVDNLEGFQIYKNQQNQLAEKHIVRVDPKIDQKDYITAYYQRYLPTKPIVNVFDAQVSQQGASMCQNTSIITVFTEYIPHRLSDVKMLNHGQGIYVLSEALTGFSELYGRVGPFQIHEDLIGFNQQGEVKVWYNPNFADNAVENDRIILMSTVNPYDFDLKFSQNQEHDMIEDTINIIAKHTHFHPQFLQQAQQLKKMSFHEAGKILSKQIARKAYYVPDHLFLSDKRDIIKKSGIEVKHKHVYNPNKPKKGTKYPYFMDQGSGNAQQILYDPNYQQQVRYADYDYDDSSDTSSQSDQYGGYYNLNGQNYRIIGTKEVEGNNINEQAIINEILQKNNATSSEVYSQSPQYQYVDSRTAQHNYVQQPQYYLNQPPVQQPVAPVGQYRQGHIVMGQNPNLTRNTNNRVFQVQNYQQNIPVTSQQNVRVFSVGQNGQLVEQRQGSSVNYHPPANQNYVQYQPHYQPSTHTSQVNRSTVVPLNFAPQVPNQIQIDPLSITHRHKIFEQPPQQDFRREVQTLPQQKAF